MAGKFAKVEAPVAAVHSNLEQAIIQITEDRLRLCLMDYLGKVSDRKAWIAPASLLAAILTTFATTKFQDFAKLSADTWAAVFLISGGLTLGWLVICVLKLRGGSPTIDDVVGRIKNKQSHE